MSSEWTLDTVLFVRLDRWNISFDIHNWRLNLPFSIHTIESMALTLCACIHTLMIVSDFDKKNIFLLFNQKRIFFLFNHYEYIESDVSEHDHCGQFSSGKSQGLKFRAQKLSTIIITTEKKIIITIVPYFRCKHFTCRLFRRLHFTMLNHFEVNNEIHRTHGS